MASVCSVAGSEHRGFQELGPKIPDKLFALADQVIE